jgi:hypothetical protein
MSLLRVLVSDRVFKIGNSVKADLTRIKKQFPQLHKQGSFNVIDLKEHCIQRGIIQRNGTGSLDVLLEKTLGMYLSKNEQYRKCEDWERTPLDPSLLRYAALDVYACRLIFEKTILISPIAHVEFNSTPGTAVVLLAHEGGLPSAYGTIVDPQPSTYGSIRVKTPTKSRLLVEIHEILAPAAAAILHRLPGHSNSRTKSGALTLDQLKEVAGSEPLKVVVPISHLKFDERKLGIHTVYYFLIHYMITLLIFSKASSSISGSMTIKGNKFTMPTLYVANLSDETRIESESTEADLDSASEDGDTEADLQMLEAFAKADRKRHGKSL